MTLKIDATRPFYAFVGAGDLAVELARSYATDMQARFAKVELQPNTLRRQARSMVVARVDELAEDAKEAQARLEARVADLQADAKALPSTVETYVNDAVAELNETYGELAVRGRDLMNRVRKQQATQDAKAAAQTTVAKAKTTKTQTGKAAKSSSSTAKKAAKKTSATAKRNTKATTTSAKRTASSSAKAASSAAAKVGD